MKKMMRSLLGAAFMLAFTSMMAQDYMLSFAIQGEDYIPDSIKVSNPAQGTSVDLDGDDILKLILDITGIDTGSEPYTGLQIYPNPAGSSTTLAFFNAEEGQVLIRLYSHEGRLILQSNEKMSAGYQNYILSGLCSGSYFVIVTTNHWSSTRVLLSTSNSGNQSVLNLGSLLPDNLHHGYTLKSSVSEDIIEMTYRGGETLIFKAYYDGVLVETERVISSSQTLEFNYSTRADFSVVSQFVSVNTQVTFTDISGSESEVTSWKWNFGDGHTSTQQNPTHTYTVLGKFPVSLEVESSSGKSSRTMVDYIHVYELVDIDGNIYETVTIGDQVWMKENLKVSRYRDGREIPLISDSTEWSNLTLTDKAFCWYGNDDANIDTYGALYSVAAAVNGAYSDNHVPGRITGVCPEGWHVPSDAEWMLLEDNIGMSQEARERFWSRDSVAGKLLETGTEHWAEPNNIATNESGFTALPAGMRNPNAGFTGLSSETHFWSSTHSSTLTDWYTDMIHRVIWANYGLIGRWPTSSEGYGYSVRCIKGISLPSTYTIPISDIGETDAVIGCRLDSDGGAEVSEIGVCWSTNEGPTVNDNKLSTDNVDEEYIRKISGLAPLNTYYVRAYAISSLGTGYGNQVSFSTVALPTVTTANISNIDTLWAKGGGEVTSDGNSEVTARGICWSTEPSPTIDNDSTIDGNGLGSFSSTMTDLNPGTTYYVRAYAINALGTAYGTQKTFKTLRPVITGQTGTLTDIDGNTYNWVGIGKQAWMKENLKVTRYHDGIEIPYVGSNVEWGNMGGLSSAYCWYNDNIANKNTYGALYTHAAAVRYTEMTDQGACPSGWHIPTDEEWKELEIFLGMDPAAADNTGGRGTDEGGKLKSTSLWKAPNVGATNSSGFTALPAGYRYYTGFCSFLGDLAMFWSTSFYDRELETLGSQVWRQPMTGGTNKNRGYSVRCVRD